MLLFLFIFFTFLDINSDSIIFSVCNKMISEEDIKKVLPISCLLKKIPQKKCIFNDEDLQKFAIGMFLIAMQKTCYFEEMKINFNQMNISDDDLLKNYNLTQKQLQEHKIPKKILDSILKPETLFNIYVSSYFAQHYSHLNLTKEEKENQMKAIAEYLLEKIKTRYLVDQKY